MKVFTHLLALASIAHAHYTLPSMIYGGTTTPAWQHVRQWTGYYTNAPVQDVSSLDIRCNKGASTIFAPSTLSVAAGSTLGFKVDPNVYHAGPVLAYMAKVPSGKTAANWDGSGSVWFKVYQQGPTFSSGSISWPSLSATTLSFRIPNSTPNGDYLVRMEQIGLHSASAAGGSQHYISCGQVTVTGGGSGNPSPKVAFPGAYNANDPGLKINIYYPVPTTYTFPGPAVWSG